MHRTVLFDTDFNTHKKLSRRGMNDHSEHWNRRQNFVSTSERLRTTIENFQKLTKNEKKK